MEGDGCGVCRGEAKEDWLGKELGLAVCEVGAAIWL